MDETDVEILKVLMDHPDITATVLAMELFSPKNDLETRKKDAFLRYRLATLESYGLIKVSKESGKNRYRVPLESMSIGKVTIRIEGCDEEVEIGNGLYIPNGECNRLILLD